MVALRMLVLLILGILLHTDEVPMPSFIRRGLHCWPPKAELEFSCSIISDNAAMFERKRLRMIKLALGLMISDNAAGDG